MTRPLDPEILAKEACSYYRIHLWDFRHKPGDFTRDQVVRKARAAFVYVLTAKGGGLVRKASEVIGYKVSTNQAGLLRSKALDWIETDLEFAHAVQQIERATRETMKSSTFNPNVARRVKA